MRKYFILKIKFVLKGGFFFATRWRSWLRHCATSRKVAGSIPDGVIGIFHWHNPSCRTMVLGSTQHLTEMSTRIFHGGWRRPVRRADNLTTFMCRLSWKLGASASWNPQGLSRPVMGSLYIYLLPQKHTCIIRGSRHNPGLVKCSTHVLIAWRRIPYIAVGFHTLVSSQWQTDTTTVQELVIYDTYKSPECGSCSIGWYIASVRTFCWTGASGSVAVSRAWNSVGLLCKWELTLN